MSSFGNYFKLQLCGQNFKLEIKAIVRIKLIGCLFTTNYLIKKSSFLRQKYNYQKSLVKFFAVNEKYLAKIIYI